MEFDYDKIRVDALQGPRLTTLFNHFEDIASKNKQCPSSRIKPSKEFLLMHKEYKKYYTVFKQNLGVFNSHTLASIPYVLEQYIRMGVALSNYAESKGKTIGNPLTFYGISTADGTHARTLAEYSDGKVFTLTDSPNKSNELEFYNHLNHKYSFFHLGSFIEITPEYLVTNNHNTDAFSRGFDVIWEDTAFQMYSKNRCDQIAYSKRILKDNGLFIFLEKLNRGDIDKYLQMEDAKDILFKSKYFSKSEIAEKKQTILNEMEKYQVTLPQLSRAIESHFKYAFVVWSCTNFFEIVASNNYREIKIFISLLPEPFVPAQFSFQQPIIRPLF